MKIQILATPHFEQKLSSLSQTYRDAFSRVLINIKNLNSKETANYLGVYLTYNSIQFYKLGSLRIFLNFTKDKEKNDTLLFVDLTLDVAPLSSNRNPRINGSINPRINGNINPRFNTGFDGFYFYDLNSTAFEFVIPENNQEMLLFFDFSGEQTKYAIKHLQNGYVIFDLNGEWVGHLESDSENGFNYFNLDNEWVGFLK